MSIRYHLAIGTSIISIVTGALSTLAKDEQREVASIESEPVEIAGTEYRMRYTEANGISMSVRRSDQTAVAYAMMPAPFEGITGDIVDVALSRWTGRSLVAVVAIDVSGTVREFYCITIPIPDPEYEGEVTVACGSARVMSGSRKDSILALSGSRSGDTIVLVVGQASAAEAGMIVQSGQIMIHMCPNPSAAGATSGRFVPLYE